LIECGAAEIIAGEPQKRPQIIHAWVEACKRNFSTGESKVANAVLRKFAESYDNSRESAKSLEDYALLYSHPAWLAKSWAAHFGKEKACEIMHGNQKPSEVFFRISTNNSALIAFAPFVQYFEKTNDPYFFKMKGGQWQHVCELLGTPYAYVQDPSTGQAPRLLNPQPGEKILDLCAAPGGKSRLIADLLLLTGQNLSKNLLLSVDIEGPRFEKLKANLAKIDFLPVRTLACDLLKEDFAAKLKENELPG
jgi:16S rRNA (cytosine967-C5)-methyltransferase